MVMSQEHVQLADTDGELRRQKVRFPSGSTECAAWYYPGKSARGTATACVVMAGGFGVTKEPGTDRFARAFASAGLGVLAFDYRGLGESGGEPRLVQRLGEQLADWDAALAYAATLPGVDPQRLAVWGFSSSGGHVFRVAARHPELAAAIAQSPNVDGRAATRNAMRYQRPPALLRLLGRSLLDALGGLFGREPLLVPLAGPPGTVALLTTPDAVDGGRILDPDGRYPDWQQMIAARSTLWLGSYRPGLAASAVTGPLLVVACDDDCSALAAPAVAAAERAPRGELLRLPGGHYAPFLAAHEDAVAAELAFLHRHLGPDPANGS